MDPAAQRLFLTTRSLPRLQAYGVLLLGSGLAGLLGLAFDQLTVTVSQEYFTLGKGLSPESLRAQVAWLGFRSALPLGALATGLGLLRAQRVRSFSWARWCSRIATAMALALAVLPVAMLLLDPFEVRTACSGSLPATTCSRYLVAWGLHVGAYIGFAAGLCLALLPSRE